MRRIALLINPVAGRGIPASLVQDLVGRLEKSGYASQVMLTSKEPFSAKKLAQEACETCDTVFACGGDGTIHEVIQALAGSSTVLGVLPLGTANALARNLRLPLDPIAALKRLLTFTAKLLPLGCAESSAGPQWFAVMAGAGPDGILAREVSVQQKIRYGRGAYYLAAARVYATRRFPLFQVEYREPGHSEWKAMQAIAMMAARIPNLGGLFSGLTHASSLHHPYLLVHLLRAPAKIALPAWFAYGRLGRSQINPWLMTIKAEELRCTSLHPEPVVFAQLDGEPQGPIPMHLKIVPNALRLLMPHENELSSELF